MANQSGTFQFTNLTGRTLPNPSACHVADGHETTVSEAKNLAHGKSSEPVAFFTDTNTRDIWVAVVQGYLQGYHSCGFESEDDGGNVVLVYYPTSYDIIMPQSSSCKDKDYNGNPAIC